MQDEINKILRDYSIKSLEIYISMMLAHWAASLSQARPEPLTAEQAKTELYKALDLVLLAAPTIDDTEERALRAVCDRIAQDLPDIFDWFYSE